MKIVRPEDRICEIIEFDRRRPHIISFVGAGGKTTLISRLGGELRDRGLRVIVTTTTKMYRPMQDYLEWTGEESERELAGRLGESRASDADKAAAGGTTASAGRIVTGGGMVAGGMSASAGRIVTVGRTIAGGKITGAPEAAYPALVKLADVLLVEADGSRRKPFKVPAEHEPVLFPGTDLAVAVLGMRSVGMRIADAAQRPRDAARFLQTDVEHRITREDLERVFDSPRGLRKGVDCAYLAVGNQYGSDIF